jgi:hypothetical protein
LILAALPVKLCLPDFGHVSELWRAVDECSN